MRLNANLTFKGSGDLDIPDRHFWNQSLDVRPETKSGRIGINGRLYVSRCPTTVTWYGGTVDLLSDVVQVRISSADSQVIEGILSAGKLRNIDGGICFELEPYQTD